MASQCPPLPGPRPPGGSRSNDLSSACRELRPRFWPHHPTRRRERGGRCGGGSSGQPGSLHPALKHEARGPTAAPEAWTWHLSKIWGHHRDWPLCHPGLPAGQLGTWATPPCSEAEEDRGATRTARAWDQHRGPSGAQASTPRPPAEPRASGNQVGHRRLIPTSQERCHGNVPSKHSAITKAAQKALLSSFSKHSSSNIGHFFVMGEGEGG